MGSLAYGSTPLYARTLRVKCLPIFPNQSENRRRRENKITQKSISLSSVPHLSYHLSLLLYNKLPLKRRKKKKKNNRRGIGQMGQMGQMFVKVDFPKMKKILFQIAHIFLSHPTRSVPFSGTYSNSISSLS